MCTELNPLISRDHRILSYDGSCESVGRAVAHHTTTFSLLGSSGSANEAVAQDTLPIVCVLLILLIPCKWRKDMHRVERQEYSKLPWWSGLTELRCSKASFHSSFFFSLSSSSFFLFFSPSLLFFIYRCRYPDQNILFKSFNCNFKKKENLYLYFKNVLLYFRKICNFKKKIYIYILKIYIYILERFATLKKRKFIFIF